jgi:hypothetical protein
LFKRYKKEPLLNSRPAKLLLVFVFTITNVIYGQNEQDDTLPSPFKILYAMDVYRTRAVDSLKYLIPILDSVWESDQKYRYHRANETAAASVERFNRHAKEIRYIDSVNVVIVTGILDRYGWIDKKRIGFLEGSALFFVIQHANIDIQEKYLPSLRKAVFDKIESPHNLTMLEDRVSLRKKNTSYMERNCFFIPARKDTICFP